MDEAVEVLGRVVIRFALSAPKTPTLPYSRRKKWTLPYGLLVGARYSTLMALTEQVNIVAVERGMYAFPQVTDTSTEASGFEYTFRCVFTDCGFTVRAEWEVNADGSRDVVISRESAHTCVFNTEAMSKPVFSELVAPPQAYTVACPKKHERYASLDDVVHRAVLSGSAAPGLAVVTRLERPETDCDGRMSGGSVSIRCSRKCKFHVYASTTTTWSPNFALVESSAEHDCQKGTRRVVTGSVLGIPPAVMGLALTLRGGELLKTVGFFVLCLWFFLSSTYVWFPEQAPNDARDDRLAVGNRTHKRQLMA